MNHPNVHLPWSQWSEDQRLHVAVAYSNPFRWQTRRELLNDFRRHMESQPNVVLHVGELAYGDRPHEVTSPDNPNDVQLRTTCELFHKENIQNVVIQHFPPNWRYGAAIDGDFHFTRHDWALEAVHQLQHYDWVQLYSSYTDLSGKVYGLSHVPLRMHSTFFFNYIQNGFKVSDTYHNRVVPIEGAAKRRAPAKAHPAYYDGEEMLEPGAQLIRGVGATGGAHAFRRTAFERVGGFLDRCILGHADWYMAFGLVDIEPPDIHSQHYHPHYKSYVNAWRDRARSLKKNVGYVDQFATHFFHGSKTRRAYSSRDVILAEHLYTPYEDVHPDAQGVLQLNPEKPRFRDDIRRYFTSRAEDDPNLYGSEKLMV